MKPEDDLRSEAGSRLVVSSTCLSIEENNERVILDTSTGKYFGLNGTATFIWECVENGMAVEEIIATYQRRYNVPTDRATADVNRCVGQLRKSRLFQTQIL